MSVSADSSGSSITGSSRPESKSPDKPDVREVVDDESGSDTAKPNPIEQIANDSIESGFEEYSATAYCLNGSTATGVRTREGVIAADPRVIPLGSVVSIKAGHYSGTYVAVDTGGRIKGHIVDIFMPNLKEARAFGRRKIKLKVIGHTLPANLKAKPAE